MRRMRAWLAAAIVSVGLGLVATATADDWPAHRHDLARSGVTKEKLPTPLHRQWVYVAAHAPRPAWPEPGRELNRVAFDYSFGVTAAKGRLYFGSSADHTVRCLDLATGKERWRFFTGGPVRFAPTLAEGRVLVGSDDGWLYCLAASDGKLLWRFHAAPSDEMLLGNGQMISRWPLRAGVGVEKGIAYFAAGMWPSEGVYVYALRIQDGSVVWKNDTSGTQYLKQPHPGSFSMTGVAPQGYVLAQGDQVFVPTGRNVPAAYDRATGKLLYYRSAPSGWGNRWGGGWNFLVDGMLIGWTCHIGPDINVLDGEYDPDPKDGLVVYDAATGKEKREAAGKLCAVASKGILYASGSGSVTAYDLKAWVGRAKAKDCTKWDTPHSRAYAMILAGNTLAIGGQGMVTTLDATSGKQSWYDKVDGQARTLAVADGRLLVSTSEGQIVCYAPDAPTRPTTINRRETPPAARPDIATVVQARSLLEKAAKKEGFCLVLGTGKPGFLQALAEASSLTIVCLEPDAEKVAAARQALAAARLYGTRVVVHHGSPASLPYPDYFADLILATSDTADLLEKCPAADVYRVLRPLGGRLFVETPKLAGGVAGSIGRGLGLGSVTPRWVTRWLANGGVPADETSTAGSVVQVVRGAMPESDDWTHQYATPARTGASNDRSARLPLKLLWFGEPGPAPLVARHWGGPSPLCVKGRMFVIGERCLIAVDAYNGRELWRRDFPGVAWWPVRVRGNSVAADEDSVYLVQGKQCLRLDAATGDTLATYDMPPAPAEVDPARVPTFRWAYLATGHGRVLGAMGTDRESKCLFVLAKDGKPRWTFAAHGTVTNNAASMDDRRVYLIDQTSAAEVARAKRRGKTIPAKTRLVALDADTGTVAWQATDGISGRSELWLADGILVATSRSGMTGFDAATGKTLYTRNAASGRFPVITDGSIYAEPFGFDLRTGKPKTRPNPLTGKEAPWDFRRSYGCGSISGSPNMLLFRSGTLGMYDLAGDSGVHNFGGVRAGCYVNAIVANGVVLCPPGDATCTCSYSLRTTVALISAGDKEHWSIFYDRLPNASVTKAALNLDAPGDRRDPSGTIWLGVPRPDTRSDRPDAAMPFRLDFHDGGGAYQRSLAGLSIGKTDLPWVYANGVQGIRKATLDLEILDPGIVAWPTARTPRIDGILAEPCWDDYHAVAAPGGAAVSVRYDDAHLYLAYERPAATDGKGAPQPWKAAVKDADGPVWKDDSFNVILSPLPRAAGQPSPRCIHLGVSASGARYDAAWQFVSPFPLLDIPKHAVKVDGKADDWADAGLHVLSLTSSKGRMRGAADFDPSFRMAWTDAGLALLVQVKDNAVAECPDAGRLWEGDSVELFMTPRLGSGEVFQVAIAPGADGKQTKPRYRFYDARRATRSGGALKAQVAGAKTPDGYLVEALLPWRNLKIKAAQGGEVGVQLFVNDKDPGKKGKPFRVQWHAGGHPVSSRNPKAFHRLRLAAKPSSAVGYTRAAKPDKAGLFAAVAPHPYPFVVPPLGARGEDAKYTAQWTSAVQADRDALVIEAAIPWKTLAAAGMSKTNLMIDVVSRGPLGRAPALGGSYQRVILVSADKMKPRTFAVRLHFAELEDVRRGERVFDVELQGKTVLEGFDVVRAARGRHRAVVKEFDGVVARRAITLEFIPKAAEANERTAPILSAIEILPSGE